MKHFRLHSQFLEDLFGPIRLEIVQQGNGLRMVHLRDATGVSRTLGVVQFYGTPPEPFARVHRKILEGSPLGPTLLEAGIDFEKRVDSRFRIAMPHWLRRAFLSGESHATGVLSDLYIRNPKGGPVWQYARVLEVIPPEVYAGMALGDLPTPEPGPEARELLTYANIKPSYNK